MSHSWFRRELNYLMPNGDLRLVRDPHRLGMDLWVVERRLPAREHVEGLEHLRLAQADRFIKHEVPGIGYRYYDCAPEWSVVHICRSRFCIEQEHEPPQFSFHHLDCVREPNSGDIESLRRWLFEFRDFEHSQAVFRRERQEHKAKLEKEQNLILRKELKSSHDFRQLVFGDSPERVLEGTSI